MPDTDRITLRGVPPELWRATRAELLRQGKPLGALITELLTQWLAEQRAATTK